MNDWQSTYLGRGALPRDLSGFEIEGGSHMFHGYRVPRDSSVNYRPAPRRSRSAACLARFPQIAMLHQRRAWPCVRSRNSNVHP
jgi:hypothetical protein